MAYSLDLRQRVLAALERGMEVDEAVSTFQVGRSTIFRWQAQQRTTGTLAARTSPGRRRLIAEGAEAALLSQLEQQPDEPWRSTWLPGLLLTILPSAWPRSHVRSPEWAGRAKKDAPRQ
jgi:transposase